MDHKLSDRHKVPVDKDAYFDTSSVLGTLKTSAISSGVAMGMQQGVTMLLSMVGVVVLARLLQPEDFGLVAVVFAVLTFARPLQEAGLSTAMIQREVISHAQVSNLFWANVLIGAVVTGILAGLSPLVAWFYDEPRLVHVMLALSVTFAVTGLSVQHIAILKRQMRFEHVAMIRIASEAIGIGVGIVMAVNQFGYWSLVAMAIGKPVAEMGMAWTLCRWRPQRPSASEGTWSLLSMGANLTVSGVLLCLARGVDSIVIGKWFGMEALGMYSRAAMLVKRPLDQVVGPVSSIIVPIFSRVQGDPERYRRVIFKIFDGLAVCSMPFSALLVALAEPVTLIILGQKWEQAAAVLGALALLSLYVPMVLVPECMLVSQGRGAEYLRLGIIGSIVTVLAFVVGGQFGVVQVAVSYVLACLAVQLPIAYWMAGGEGPVTSRDLWKRYVMHFPLWGIVCLATVVGRQAVEQDGPWMQMMAGIGAGLVGAAIVMRWYPPSVRAVASLLEDGRLWRKEQFVLGS